jgi:hypothetical protein
MPEGFLHSFRLAKMDPVASAARWTSPHGVRAAEGLSTHPFAALRLRAKDIWRNSLPAPILYLVSANKPAGIGEGCFVTLTEAPSTSPREFQVSPSLNSNSRPLYIHTSHYYVEPLPEDDNSDGWETTFQLASCDQERLFRAILEDDRKMEEYHEKRQTIRTSGGEEPVEFNWETWSAYSQEELCPRQPDQIYQHQILKYFPWDLDNDTDIIKELAFFKELVSEISCFCSF